MGATLGSGWRRRTSWVDDLRAAGARPAWGGEIDTTPVICVKAPKCPALHYFTAVSSAHVAAPVVLFLASARITRCPLIT